MQYSVSSEIRKALTPRRWHLLTWTLFAFWLLFAVPSNIPRWDVKETLVSNTEHDSDSQLGVSSVVYVSKLQLGWPFTFQEHTYSPPSTKIATVTHWPWFVVNLAIVLAVQFSIVFSCQRFGQFSVRLLLLVVLAVALLLTIGRAVASVWPFWGPYYLVLVVYFSPVIVATGIVFFTWWGRSRERTHGMSNYGG